MAYLICFFLVNFHVHHIYLFLIQCLSELLCTQILIPMLDYHDDTSLEVKL